MRAKFPEDDFYCWRYQVWYNSLDCATRTAFRTAPGCRNCSQGNQNLALRLAEVKTVRLPKSTLGFADSRDLDPVEEALPLPIAP